jgi:hypothetical protein
MSVDISNPVSTSPPSDVSAGGVGGGIGGGGVGGGIGGGIFGGGVAGVGGIFFGRPFLPPSIDGIKDRLHAIDADPVPRSDPGIWHFTVPSASATEGKVEFVDIVYLLDGTGSMQPFIQAAKKTALKLAQELPAAQEEGLRLRRDSGPNPTVVTRYGFVVFRDYTDQDMILVHPLTTSLETLATNLEGVQALGGGDPPENYEDALTALMSDSMDWRWDDGRHTTILVSFLDAPPHGFGDASDAYPNSLRPSIWYRFASWIRHRQIKTHVYRLQGSADYFITIAKALDIPDVEVTDMVGHSQEVQAHAIVTHSPGVVSAAVSQAMSVEC